MVIEQAKYIYLLEANLLEKLLTKVSNWLEKHLLPIADKISSQRHLMAMRDGFIAILPIGMTGLS